MPFGDQLAAVSPVARVVARPEQFAEEAFVGFDVDAFPRLAEREIEAVALKIQGGDPAGRAVAFLPVTPAHQNARTRLRKSHGAALRHHGDGPRLVAVVLDQDAAHLIADPLADIDGQLFAEIGEGALLDQPDREIVADVVLQIPELLERGRQEIEADEIADRHAREAERHDRHRQVQIAQAGRAHDHQFAVVQHLGQHEDGCQEQRDRQRDEQERRHQQRGQLEEDVERQAPVQDKLEKAGRLGQPDDDRQRDGDVQGCNRNLPHDVELHSRHAQDYTPNRRLRATPAICGEAA